MLVLIIRQTQKMFWKTVFAYFFYQDMKRVETVKNRMYGEAGIYSFDETTEIKLLEKQ